MISPKLIMLILLIIFVSKRKNTEVFENISQNTICNNQERWKNEQNCLSPTPSFTTKKCFWDTNSTSHIERNGEIIYNNCKVVI
tara:strand:- start:241 stop:492 length:252 start_codon:yes stop_codon:yes gene_type:complete